MLGVATVDVLELDTEAVRAAFPAWPDAVPYAVADVSIANSLSVSRTAGVAPPLPSVTSLETFRR